MTCDEIRAQIVFYLDHELDDDDRTAFDAHLSACPACHEEAGRERRFLDDIRNVRPLYCAPPELRERMAERFARQRSDRSALPSTPMDRRFPQRMLARAAVLLLAISALLSLGRFDMSIPQPGSRDFAEAAVAAHRRYLAGTLPLELTSDDPAAVSDWFRDKLSFPLVLPSHPSGFSGIQPYRVKGARLLGYSNNDAAYVAYEMAAMPIGLVVVSSRVATPSGGERIASGSLVFHYRTLQGYKVITWSDRDLTYALVSLFEGRGQQSCAVCHENAAGRPPAAPANS